MAEGALIDTDVLMKASAYRVANALVETLAPAGVPAALGLTHLIAPKQLRRAAKRLSDLDGALDEMERLLNLLDKIEPNDDEISFAAELDEAAVSAGFPLDSGESQLVALSIGVQKGPLIGVQKGPPTGDIQRR